MLMKHLISVALFLSLLIPFAYVRAESPRIVRPYMGRVCEAAEVFMDMPTRYPEVHDLMEAIAPLCGFEWSPEDRTSSEGMEMQFDRRVYSSSSFARPRSIHCPEGFRARRVTYFTSHPYTARWQCMPIN